MAVIRATSCITPLGNKEETVKAVKEGKVQYGVCYNGEYSFEELLDLCLEDVFKEEDIENIRLIVTANDINQEVLDNKITCSKDIFRGLSSYISTYISNKYNHTNASFGVSASCAGSLISLMLANSLIFAEGNSCTSAVCGGATNYHPLLINAFKYLHLLSDSSVKPFGKKRDGTIVSQGMGFISIVNKTEEEHFVEILKGITFRHESLVSTGSERIKTSWENLIRSSVPDMNNSVLIIDAHATGTIAGDANEAKAIEQLIEAFPDINVLVTNTKSYFGHCMAASGIVELIVLLEFIKNNSLPLYRGVLDEEFNLPVITERNKKLPENKPVYVLKHSSGLGGYDASILCKVN